MSIERDDEFNGYISEFLNGQFQRRPDEPSPQEEVPVVSRRLAWERERVAKIWSNLDRSVLVVRDDEEYRRRRSLPTLSRRKAPWGIPFDPEGNLYISWWRALETQTSPSGRTELVNPRGVNYLVLASRKHKRDVLTNVPKGQNVFELILAKVDRGIEVAIRNQEKIIGAYQGGSGKDQGAFAKSLVEYTEKIMNRFILRGGVSRTDLEDLAQETGAWLESQGIYNPRDPRKKDILARLQTVPLQDERGRANYLVLLARVGAVHTRAVEELTVGQKTVDKFEGNLRELLFERETTRWTLRLVNDHLDAVLGRLREISRPTQYQLESIANALKVPAGIEGHLTSVKVKPYLHSARWVAISLVGCREQKKELNRVILGSQEADELFSNPSIVELVRRGNIEEAAGLIKECQERIALTLDAYEDIQTAAKG
jgi:hypothetical protein